MISYWMLFKVFLILGCTSFGGPTAHLVFFHQTFVIKYQWLDENQYSQLLTLAQLLPGPTSSQVGLAIGYLQQGYIGAFLAWLGFTLPSILLMLLFAIFSQSLFPVLNSHLFHSIQLLVLVIIVFAFWQMYCSFCKNRQQRLLMLGATLFCLIVPWSFSVILLIVGAAVVGLCFSFQSVPLSQTTLASQQKDPLQSKKKGALVWMLAFWAILLLLPLCNYYFPSTSTLLFSQFFNATASVFGGGHILLPLLHQDLVTTGIIPAEKFHLGYAFAQLVPGPLFSFSSYLAVFLPLSSSIVFNVIFITIATFLSSFLLIFATLPYWSWLVSQQKIQQAIFAINAAIVGLLLSLILNMAQQDLQHIRDVIFVILTFLMLKHGLKLWFSIPLSLMLYQLLLLLNL